MDCGGGGDSGGMREGEETGDRRPETGDRSRKSEVSLYRGHLGLRTSDLRLNNKIIKNQET